MSCLPDIHARVIWSIACCCQLVFDVEDIVLDNAQGRKQHMIINICVDLCIAFRVIILCDYIVVSRFFRSHNFQTDTRHTNLYIIPRP